MRHKSERVPGKNYRNFLGRPLFEHILDTLQACPRIDRIVVDTDSPTIRSGIAESHPEVGLVDRPERLRSATIPMTAILLHDVTEVPADFYLQTHCTNPLLTTDTVNRCIEEFLGAHPVYDSLFSVTARQARALGRCPPAPSTTTRPYCCAPKTCRRCTRRTPASTCSRGRPSRHVTAALEAGRLLFPIDRIEVTCPQEWYHILCLVPAPVEGREGRASSGTRATA